MAKYAVYVTEILNKKVVIEADNQQEACDNVEKLYGFNIINMDRKDDFSECNIEVDKVCNDDSDFKAVSYDELQDDDLVIFTKINDLFKVIRNKPSNNLCMANEDFSNIITLVKPFYEKEKANLRFYRKIK
mgnify:FL=1